MIKTLLLVGFGGGAGSILRFAVQKWIPVSQPAAFPFATFLVNISGGLLIGLLWGWSARLTSWNEDLRLLLMAGFCGGFTTFSAFTLESISLIREQKAGLFFIYVCGSVILGLLATWAGIRLLK